MPHAIDLKVALFNLSHVSLLTYFLYIDHDRPCTYSYIFKVEHQNYDVFEKDLFISYYTFTTNTMVCRGV